MPHRLLFLATLLLAGCTPNPPAPVSKGAAYDVIAAEWKAAGDELTSTSMRVGQLELQLSSAAEADKAAILADLEAAKAAVAKAEQRTETARQKLLEAEKDMD
jgi:hypothetical protein